MVLFFEVFLLFAFAYATERGRANFIHTNSTRTRISELIGVLPQNLFFAQGTLFLRDGLAYDVCNYFVPSDAKTSIRLSDTPL